MSPSTATHIHSPSPILISSSETRLDASATQSQQTIADRPQRNRTPTPRGREFQDEVRRSKALSAKIRQTKARNALGKGQGGGKGQGKRRAPTPQSDACDTDDENGDDDDDDDDDSSWIVDDSSAVVPTSNPNELEDEGGSTFQTQLDDTQFCADLSERLTALLKGEVENPSSREALKKALRFVRRDQASSLGTSQWYTQTNSLPQQPVEGGGGHHLDYEPQPGQKRRFVAPQIGPSKRGRLTTSGTPSTVLDSEPNPIPRPIFPVQPHSNGSPVLPQSAADRDAVGLSPHLPVSAAIPVPARSWSQPLATGSQPLPARNSQLEDTQTVPEDTQTVPEDTQTMPEDTQTQPDETQHLPMSLSQPRASQPQAVASQQGRSSRPSAQPFATSTHASVTPVGPAARVLSRGASQFDAMSDRFDQNERHRARAYAILQKRNGRAKHAEPDDSDLMEEDAADRAEAQNVVSGKPTKRKKKSGLNCQPGRPRQVATRAVTDVTAYSFAKGPYFTRGTGLIWSQEAFERSAIVEFPGKPVDQAIPELLSAICDRIAGGRTVLKSNMRSSITSSYGFKLDPVFQEEIDKNIKIYNDIHEDFHFGSLGDPQSHYEHPGLTKAFLAGFFAARHSPCVVYSHYFNPVSVEAFVTLLVMMDTCIAEWRTGTQVKEHLNSKEQKVLYDKHMASVDVFARGAPVRFYRLRKGLYEAGMQKMALATGPDSSVKPSIRLEDVRPDTPPPAGHEAGGGA